MAPKLTFEGSGLKRLAAILDWNNEDHRRSVAASLVQGVYALEHERQGSQAPDPSWWMSFGFQSLPRILIDEDGSYFGAVYEYNSTSITPNIPRYVIAFRGTLLKPDNMFEDMKLNLKLLLNELEDHSRLDRAMKTVTAFRGASNVWLAGHSLGAAIALFTGKQMMMMGSCCTPIETYLFNPPFISIPIEWIKSETVKKILLSTKRLFTAGVALFTLNIQQRDSFSTLASWTPYLFVNPYDPICYGYIEYFKQRRKLFGRLATQHTLRSLTVSRRSDSEQLHILPSAHMVINKIPFSSFKDSHALHQWFNPDNQYYKSETHKFNDL